jgi:hypothetical protein
MPLSSDFIFAKGTTQSEWDFLAIPGNVPTTTPTWSYTTKFQGIDPRFKIGGELRGWFYGVLGVGGHAVDEGRKVGPDVNGYSDFAGVRGTGVFVTGVAGTSIFGPGVYGQMGEDPDASIPKNSWRALLSGRRTPPRASSGGRPSHTASWPLRRTASAWRGVPSTASASSAVATVGRRVGSSADAPSRRCKDRRRSAPCRPPA